MMLSADGYGTLFWSNTIWLWDVLSLKASIGI